MVLGFNRELLLTIVNKSGMQRIQAKSIILAMGCREKTRWNALIPGTRPSGIYTAGVAQMFINLYNKMPGENVVVLGSGDVGLIMARRLKFEGANVLGVVEILPYATGLPRNVVQCLEDYDIPLLLSHTITCIRGKERLESVTVAKVDEKRQPIKGTEKEIHCDTLLLSLGLIPENELSKNAGVEIDALTGGPTVNQYLETCLPGVFACGNCLQVYDTVDMLSMDAKKAGVYAAEYVSRRRKKGDTIRVIPGKGVRYVVPQRVDAPGRVSFTFRVDKPGGPSTLYVKSEEEILLKKKMRWMNPANMVRVDVPISREIVASKRDVEVTCG
jgi:NADPH-dependent 2,4-dienoyl-CoA reductase/sulfur reductase-like enzyme